MSKVNGDVRSSNTELHDGRQKQPSWQPILGRVEKVPLATRFWIEAYDLVFYWR
jgi:hypothetical protein